MVQRKVPLLFDVKNRRSCIWGVLQAASLLAIIYVLINVLLVSRSPNENKVQKILVFVPSSSASQDNGTATVRQTTQAIYTDRNETTKVQNNTEVTFAPKSSHVLQQQANITCRPAAPKRTSTRTSCENENRPPGSQSLPKGIVVKTSNLDMRPLWGNPEITKTSRSLLALAVGIKQTKLVDDIVRKFLDGEYVVMLFHYDGNVDEWKKFQWHDQVIHVSAPNQTKWWFAKRFLHPDVVAEYDYIFLWDEDLGVKHFDPQRYVSIVKEEGLEISQPGLDTSSSEVHHQITARGRRGNVHRRTFKAHECDEKSTAPPCTGWIEVMAPVFSRAAWRCVWYMIQNDLIHAWGLDIQLGYCAQGDRTQKIGIVDTEYVVHLGLPTLGEPKGNKVPANSHAIDKRIEVRRQSWNEYKVFRRRWQDAVAHDKCWVNPYPEPLKPITL